MSITEVVPVVPVVVEPVVPAVEPAPDPSALAAEIATLKAKLATAEEQVAAGRLNTAIKQSNSAAPISSGQADVARDRVIAAIGGPARWFALTEAQRLTALGQPLPSTQDVADCARAFGKGSDAKFANSLSKQDAARYSRLRILAIETGRL